MKMKKKSKEKDKPFLIIKTESTQTPALWKSTKKQNLKTFPCDITIRVDQEKAHNICKIIELKKNSVFFLKKNT